MLSFPDCPLLSWDNQRLWTASLVDFVTLEPHEVLVTVLLKKLAPPKTFGNSLTSPARIAGMHAQKTADVVSRVDQNIVGILSHVGSAVNPKFFRL